MLKRLENKLRMFDAVKQLLDRNTGAWQGIQMLAAIVNEFFEKIGLIANTRKITESPTTGGTADKNMKEQELADLIYEVSSALYTLAVRTNNQELKNKVAYTERDLQAAREGEMVTIGENVAALARENLGALAGYQVDEAKVSNLETRNAEFRGMVSAPRADIAQRMAANALLKELFAEISELLKNQMDRMMVPFKNTNPDFYNAYMNARVIVDHGIRHVTSGEPVQTV